MGQRQAVIFELDQVLYGLDIMEVQEIIRMVEITPVAEANLYMEGVINLRGHVIPVINLCRMLGLSSKELDKDSRIIVAENEGVKKGLIVDRVLEVGNYDDVETIPSEHVGFEISYLREIVKRGDSLWLILNLSQLN